MTTPREVIADELFRVVGDASVGALHPAAVYADRVLAALEAAGYSVVKLEWWGAVDQDGHAADLKDVRSDERYRADFYAEFGKFEPEPVWEPLFRVVSDQPRGDTNP